MISRYLTYLMFLLCLKGFSQNDSIRKTNPINQKRLLEPQTTTCPRNTWTQSQTDSINAVKAKNSTTDNGPGRISVSREVRITNYLDALAKAYPPGITIEKSFEGSKEIERYIVVRNG